jgi:hypothetical protein
VAHVTQAEFCRAVRGGAVNVGSPPPVEPLVLGLNSIARSAVRKVHQQSPANSLAYFDKKAAPYFAGGGGIAGTAQSFRECVERYIRWDATAAPAQLDISEVIAFGTGNSVRARAHVVLDDGTGSKEVRLLLWDELPVSAMEAELLALPVLACAEARIGAGSVSRAEIWQLATNQREVVVPATARARYPAVQQVLSQL